MNKNLPKFVELIKQFEGGFVDDPDDPGGATNMGITLSTYMAHKGLESKEVALAQLKNLTEEEAVEIYRSGYWNQVSGGKLASGIDIFVADWAIHSGPQRAIIELQSLIGVTPDGILGPISMEALKEEDPARLLQDLHNERFNFYHDITYGKSTRKFLKGWLNRLHKLYIECLDLIDEGT